MSSVPVPAAVEEAIADFDGGEVFEVLPAKVGEWSTMFKWGVRVMDVQTRTVGWICLGTQTCRDRMKFYPLHGGKTSNAMQHLSRDHNITAHKTHLVSEKKRSRQDEIEHLEATPMFEHDKPRLFRLIATRMIVYNNLPFRTGEYDDWQVITQLMMKEGFKVTLDAKIVSHHVVELYAAAKKVAIRHLSNARLDGVASFTMVVDFWTCKVQAAKYLGVRVYFVDQEWNMRSILLGTRRFDPGYGERARGIRGPFKRWLKQMTSDFGLSTDDFFGAMSDAGSDVKWMMTKGIGLQWEWCLAHLLNAATKFAFGIEAKTTTKNPDMTQLVEDLRRTVRIVRDVSTMGSLFESLCQLEGTDKAVRLVNFQAHRFLGLTKLVERVLEKWEPLEEWFAARPRKPGHAQTTQFPLAGKRELLHQMLSLLKPISALNAMSQAEAPTQVQTLLTLYRLRMVTLNAREPLRDHRSTSQNERFFVDSDLHKLVVKTRRMLCDALDQRFFKRYTDLGVRMEASFVFEVQLLLQPQFKNLDVSLAKIVRFCNAQAGGSADVCNRAADNVKRRVLDKVRKAMTSIARRSLSSVAVSRSTEAHVDAHEAFSDELLSFFGSNTEAAPAVDVNETRVEEEMQRWLAEPAASTTNVLRFWKQQAEDNNYKYLPQVARLYFAVPISSAQIERDFGQAGRMVTPQRASLANHNVDMCSFICANKEFVDLAQVNKIDEKERSSHYPTHVLIDVLDNDDGEFDMDVDLPDVFSSASWNEEWLEDTT